jgi:hypothetical protein
LQFRLMTINIRFSAKELHVTGYIKIELMWRKDSRHLHFGGLWSETGVEFCMSVYIRTPYPSIMMLLWHHQAKYDISVVINMCRT